MAKKKPIPKVIHASSLQKVEKQVVSKPLKSKSKSKAINKVAIKSDPKTEEVVIKEAISKPERKSFSISVSKKNVFFLLAIGLVLVVGVFAYSEYRQSQNLANNPDLAKEEEAKNVRKNVSKHAIFPEVEDATVATIKDTSTFKDQAFFKEAKVGDKVLVYAKSKRVVLYRPSIDRIVNMTELSVTSGSESTKE